MPGQVKQYAINKDWGINCIQGADGKMGIEVIMLCVPWQEVVEAEYGITEKDRANKLFKELVAKYKAKGEISYYEG